MTSTSVKPNALIRPDKDTFLNEENPFEAMMSRFDHAAKLLIWSRDCTRSSAARRSRSSSRCRS